MQSPTPFESPCAVSAKRRQLTIGLPTCTDPAERRFPLTPEGAAQIIEQGFGIKMQEGAAAPIHYADAAYERAGVELTARAEAMGCDIVIYPAAFAPAEVKQLRRGAILLTLFESACRSPRTLAELLRHNIITVALDLVTDQEGHTPFADILAEIDGRAAVAIASSLLADAVHGKGILLGGVAGIIPCETLVVGSGIAACAAARSAMGLGSMVRMFDNDIYSLRRAAQELGPGVVTSACHPRTLASALRSADVVVVTDTAERFVAHEDLVATMKKGVLSFDLTRSSDGGPFPSMVPIDLASASALDAVARASGRICFTHAGSAVARTAAMALSNTLLTFLGSLSAPEAPSLKLPKGIQRGTLTFFGKPVHPRVAELVGMRSVDISIFLSLS